MAIRRAETVAVAALSKSLDRAIALAARQHNVVFGRENVIYNWEIVGRILQEMRNPEQTRLEVAEAVMKNLPNVRGQAVVTRIGRDILVGFIERVGRTIRF
jgi:hypothetical protein